MVNQTLQPILCGVGTSYIELTDVYVFYANIFYKLPNIVQAVDVAFKIFQVLDLQYPLDCQTVWRFLQSYIYEFPLNNKEKDNILVTILNDIQTL